MKCFMNKANSIFVHIISSRSKCNNCEGNSAYDRA